MLRFAPSPMPTVHGCYTAAVTAIPLREDGWTEVPQFSRTVIRESDGSGVPSNLVPLVPPNTLREFDTTDRPNHRAIECLAGVSSFVTTSTRLVIGSRRRITVEKGRVSLLESGYSEHRSPAARRRGVQVCYGFKQNGGCESSSALVHLHTLRQNVPPFREVTESAGFFAKDRGRWHPPCVIGRVMASFPDLIFDIRLRNRSR